jgi:hypothetical protein
MAPNNICWSRLDFVTCDRNWFALPAVFTYSVFVRYSVRFAFIFAPLFPASLHFCICLRSLSVLFRVLMVPRFKCVRNTGHSVCGFQGSCQLLLANFGTPRPILHLFLLTSLASLHRFLIYNPTHFQFNSLWLAEFYYPYFWWEYYFYLQVFFSFHIFMNTTRT